MQRQLVKSLSLRIPIVNNDDDDDDDDGDEENTTSSAVRVRDTPILSRQWQCQWCCKRDRSSKPLPVLMLLKIKAGTLWVRFRIKPNRHIPFLVLVLCWILFATTCCTLPKNTTTSRNFGIHHYPRVVFPVPQTSITTKETHTQLLWFGKKRMVPYTHYEDPHYKRLEELCNENDAASCEIMGDWQIGNHPSCNSIHEIDLTMSSTITNNNHHSALDTTHWVASGHFRDVWHILDSDQHTPQALKTLRYTEDRAFDPRTLQRHQEDAVAHDVLTSSPFIANIYGYCGNSALHDFSTGGSLFDLFQRNENVTKEELLRIAHRVAASVADAHHLDTRGQPTIVHSDLKPHQWIMIDGEYQLNDFNRNILLTWNPIKNRTNTFHFFPNGGIWRSPEEYANEKETEKIDVWSLGNVLYYLQTRKVPFKGLPLESVYEVVRNGGYPKVEDATILQSNHPFDVAVRKAMEVCFVKNVEQRASARDVQQVFAKALDEVL